MRLPVSNSLLRSSSILLLAAGLEACSSGTSLRCGEGTRADPAGQCVPADLIQCGDGTVLSSDGSCVPAQPVTGCGDGTRLSDSGACEAIEPQQCGPGTEERDGYCRLVNALARVTVRETPEPNNTPTETTRLTLPAIGAPPVVLGGTLHQLDTGEADMDAWMFSGQQGQRLRIRTVALGAASVGWRLVPCADLPASGCTPETSTGEDRFGVTNTGRDVEREVVLPRTGRWGVLVADIATFAGGNPVAGTAMTYTVDIEVVPTRMATPLLPGVPATGQTCRESESWTVSRRPGEPSLVDLTLESTSGTPFSGVRALWAAGPDGKRLFHLVDSATTREQRRLGPQRLVLPSGATTVHVDARYQYSPLEPYALTLQPVERRALVPTPGQTVSITGDLAGRTDDVFDLDLIAGTWIEGTLELPATTQLQPRVELRNAAYELVRTMDGTDFRLASVLGLEGPHFLVVRDRFPAAAKTRLSYTLRTDALPIGEHLPLTAGSTQSVTIPAGSGARRIEHWVAGGDLWLEARGQSADAQTLTLKAWGGDLKTAAQSSSVDGTAVFPGMYLTSGGEVFLDVGQPSQGGATLTLATRSVSRVTEVEPNGSLSEAQSLGPVTATPILVVGAVSGDPAGDWYRFDLPAAGTVRLWTDVGLSGDRVDTTLTLRDSNGQQFAYNDDDSARRPGTLFSYVEASVAAGTYVVQLKRFSESTPDDYTLWIQMTP